MKRRHFLSTSAGALAASPSVSNAQEEPAQRPNIVYLFSDQWRATDHGYMGNTEVRTPQIDLLAV